MELNVRKTINLAGDIKKDDQLVVGLNASVSTDGTSANLSQTVYSDTLYNANKSAVRKKITEFQELFYEEQDKLEG